MEHLLRIPLRAAAIWLCLGVLLSTGCRDTLEPRPVDFFGVLTKTTIAGAIFDDSGIPVANATVSIAGSAAITTSDTNGLFLFRNIDVPEQHCQIRCERKGYYTSTRTLQTVVKSLNAVKLVMAAEKLSGTINAVSGGTVLLESGAQVSLPAGSVVLSNGDVYTGQVNLYGRYLDPSKNVFSDLAPGNDMNGLDRDGVKVQLLTLGVLDLKLETPSGQPLEVGNGRQATLTFPIPSLRSNITGQTVPVWYFNPLKGYWVQDATADRSGSVLIASVGHFTSWTCALASGRASVSGHIVDCDGNPVSGATVFIDSHRLTTDTAGGFNDMVPAGWQLALHAYCGAEAYRSQVQTLPALVAGQTYDAGTITCTCPAFLTGNVQDCSGPAPAFMYYSWKTPGTSTRQIVTGQPANGVFSIPAAPSVEGYIVMMGYNGTVATIAARTGTVKSKTDAGTGFACTERAGFAGPGAITLKGGPFSPSGETYRIRGLTATTADFFDPIRRQNVNAFLCSNAQNDSVYCQFTFADTTGQASWLPASADGKTAVFLVTVYKAGQKLQLQGISGSVIVTSVSRLPGGRYEGTFEGTASALINTGSGTVKVSGTFSALH